jgi:hypothetical protein
VAEVWIGRSDDRHLGHLRMAGEHVLDLQRVDVLSAGDDHVVDPAEQPEVAVTVEPADVARVVPAVPDRQLVGIGAVPEERGSEVEGADPLALDQA